MQVTLSVLTIRYRHGERRVSVYLSPELALASRLQFLEGHFDSESCPPREEIEHADIDDCVVEIPVPTEALIAEALAFKAEAFERTLEVNGGDMVDWFRQWRPRLLRVAVGFDAREKSKGA